MATIAIAAGAATAGAVRTSTSSPTHTPPKSRSPYLKESANSQEDRTWAVAIEYPEDRETGFIIQNVRRTSARQKIEKVPSLLPRL
ncbi:hypothetical protein ACE1CD_32940 [Aerosakkonema sp. BLCC-F183]|uniref:hypothetical protein n=1 Tax=Aerosakkonema sp. BLCC-F183 TaxID=3342834 RepID=UPI0035BB1F74